MTVQKGESTGNQDPAEWGEGGIAAGESERVSRRPDHRVPS